MILQLETGSAKKDNKYVRINPKETPITNNTWWSDHKGPETSLGIISRIYKGVIQLIFPIIKPCDRREITRVANEGIRLKKVTKIMKTLSIISDYLRENLLINCVLRIVPMAPVKNVDPVKQPWVSALG